MNKELICEIVMPDFPRQVKLSDARRAKYFKPGDKLSLKYLQKELLPKPVDNLGNISLTIEEFADGKYRNTAKDNKGNWHFLNIDFEWKEHKLTKKKVERRLYDLIKKEYVVKNPLVAGTARWEIINGQSMYNGTYHPHTRDKIMKVIHDYMLTFLQGVTQISTFPLIIEGYMFDKGRSCEISKGKGWDVGNRQFPYNKAFEDMLQHAGIIHQDDFEHIIGPPRLIFINLDNGLDSSKYGVYFPEIGLGGLCTRRLVYQIYRVCQ